MPNSPEKKNPGWNEKTAGMIIIAGLLFAGLTPFPASAGDTTPSSAKVLKNPFEGNKTAIAEGEKIFDEKCSECHMDGTGGSGPNLTDDLWIYGGSDTDVYTTVSGGRKGGMPSWKSELKEDQIWKVIAFIRSIYKK